MGANLPGQSVSSCGQPSQVASWGSHSAGMRKPRARGVSDCRDCFIGSEEFNTGGTEDSESARKGALFFAEPAIEDGLIGVDAAIAQEGPVPARFLALCRVAFNDEDFLFVMGSLGDNLTKRIGHKGISPEFQARVAIFGLAFETDAVDDSSVHAVGDGVTTLNRAPGIQLRSAKLRLLVRMPADAGRVEDDLRASERGEARAFGIPLVPADLYTD